MNVFFALKRSNIFVRFVFLLTLMEIGQFYIKHFLADDHKDAPEPKPDFEKATQTDITMADIRTWYQFLQRKLKNLQTSLVE